MAELPLLHITGSGWQEIELHLDALFLVVGMLVAYWYAVTIWRPHLPDAGRVKRSQVAYYCAGVFVVWVGAGSPIHDISEEYLLSVHMTQHLLFTLVAPPLLLAGIPTWLWTALLGPERIRPVVNVLLNPLVAILSFNMLLVITHLPHVLDFALEEHWFHFFIHVLLVATAFQMWWPIITRVPGLPQLSYPYQMAYLFVQSMLPAVVASFITFSTTPVYSFYEEAPRIWGISALEDQQIGGGVMKLTGTLILWSFIAVAFFKWFEREEAESRGLPWAEVEEELAEMGLNPKR